MLLYSLSWASWKGKDILLISILSYPINLLTLYIIFFENDGSSLASSPTQTLFLDKKAT